MTRQDVIKLLEREIAKAGGASHLARDWGISQAHICDIRHGRRAPGPRVLPRLGVTVKRVYERA